jgi:predicted nucleotidyltransferase
MSAPCPWPKSFETLERLCVRNARELIQRLVDNGVEFVIIGGFAAVAHGVTVLTRDVDMCIPCRQSASPEGDRQ